MTKQESDPNASNEQTVILIHGTFAQNTGGPGEPKWWQTESKFVKEMRHNLAVFSPQIKFGFREFRWSGANSEKERQGAAKKLRIQLQMLKADGQCIHLVGHSHGGSIIWNALQDEINAEHDLSHIASWTTIGTPFLHFGARSISLAISLVSALIAISAALLVTNIAFLPWSEWKLLLRDSPIMAIVPYALLLFALAGLVIFLFGTVIRLLLSRYRENKSSRLAHSPDAERLKTSWLNLRHELDEPINGIAASVCSPPPIAGRLSRDSNRPRDQGIRRLFFYFGPLRWWASAYDWLVASTIDSFVWQTIVSKVQGRDMPGIMKSCADSPYGIGINWPSLPAQLASNMSCRADRESLSTARRLREVLDRLQDGSGDFAQFADVVSFEEIIHTSYFDFPETSQLIARWIAMNSSQSITKSNGELQSWLEDGASPKATKSPSYFEPLKLYGVLGSGCISILILGWLAMASIWNGWILPNSSESQIDKIVKNSVSPQFTAVWDSEAIGDLAIRIAALGKLDSQDDFIESIGDPNTAVRALQRLAYGIGFMGHPSELKRLISSNSKYPLQTIFDDAEFYLILYSIAGALDGKNPHQNLFTAELRKHIDRGERDWLSPIHRKPEFAVKTISRLPKSKELLRKLIPGGCEQLKYTFWSIRVVEWDHVEPSLREISVEKCGADLTQKPDQTNDIGSGATTGGLRDRDIEAVLTAETLLNGVMSRKPHAISKKLRSLDKQQFKSLLSTLFYDDIELIVLSLKKSGEDLNVDWFLDQWLEADVSKILGAGIFGLSQIEIQIVGLADILLRVAEPKRLSGLAEHFEGVHFVDDQQFAIAGYFWLRAGNHPAASINFQKLLNAIERTGGEKGFANAILVAEWTIGFDAELALIATEVAVASLSPVFSQIGVPDLSRSIDDAVELFAKLGEFRRARELAEQVGRPLLKIGISTANQHDGMSIAEELDTVKGRGVIASYQRILDTWIKTYGTPKAVALTASKTAWPGTFPMINNVANRGD